MNTLFDVMLVALVLLCAILIFRSVIEGDNKNNSGADKRLSARYQDEREDHFSSLMVRITPTYYWRVHNEYVDFIQATIKKMSIDDVVSCPELFNAQRRCSDLNSAVYRYYENIKQRCASGEKVAVSDIDVINLRQCFNELSCKAYPELVTLIWPQYQCPAIELDSIVREAHALRTESSESGGNTPD